MAASRLEVVLRAGQEREESGLTRSLKKTSLVPTGACLPRNFDPDYCAYDRYYTVGVALVSTTIGAIINSNAPQRVVKAVAMSLRDVLAHYCHTPKPGWWFGDDWDAKEEFDSGCLTALRDKEWPPQLRERSKEEAREDFSKLCTALDLSLAGNRIQGGCWRACGGLPGNPEAKPAADAREAPASHHVSIVAH